MQTIVGREIAIQVLQVLEITVPWLSLHPVGDGRLQVAVAALLGEEMRARNTVVWKGVGKELERFAASVPLATNGLVHLLPLNRKVETALRNAHERLEDWNQAKKNRRVAKRVVDAGVSSDVVVGQDSRELLRVHFELALGFLL